jgi:hypothetical protein
MNHKNLLRAGAKWLASMQPSTGIKCKTQFKRLPRLARQRRASLGNPLWFQIFKIKTGLNPFKPNRATAFEKLKRSV